MGLLAPSLPRGTPCFGLLAQYRGPRELIHACEIVRDAGYSKWDAHTPFPVHGLDRAMGLTASKVPWIVLVTGLGGAASGMLMQWWMSAVSYPLVISGKPFFSWQAFVPITFELGVLGGALGAVFGMFALNQLPNLYHPLFNSERFEKVTDDGFFVSIRADDPKFDLDTGRRLLERAGATHVEVVEN
ncbi:MAG: DUF3341 domain-containing protein [Acidobacteriota bacterium]|nr:DUF3341 domain-containing protein [Acidobacteriota bacterium]